MIGDWNYYTQPAAQPTVSMEYAVVDALKRNRHIRAHGTLTIRETGAMMTYQIYHLGTLQYDVQSHPEWRVASDLSDFLDTAEPARRDDLVLIRMTDAR